MKQYKEMINAIKERGVHKPAARENMPGTTSLFGYQFRHNLADGFPALTTKQLYWKGVVIELIWFLSGDTNIKFLDQHGVRKMWHEDAYNYYIKLCKEQQILNPFSFELFCSIIKNTKDIEELKEESYKNSDFEEHSRNTIPKNYTLGDCGIQYGKLWREWPSYEYVLDSMINSGYENKPKDQIKELIEGLKNNPMSRRHIITAWNPATLDDMALNACHAMAQWNCRPIPWEEKLQMAKRHPNVEMENLAITEAAAGNPNYGPIPQYYLDCQMYQRSADVFLGVPLNIPSYALLTEILCKICNMVPGEMIYTYGDVHIYDDHQDAINEQLSREERDLPTLKINNGFVVEWDNIWNQDLDKLVQDIKSGGWENIFQLEDYNPHPPIKAKLSTGLK